MMGFQWSALSGQLSILPLKSRLLIADANGYPLRFHA